MRDQWSLDVIVTTVAVLVVALQESVLCNLGRAFHLLEVPAAAVERLFELGFVGLMLVRVELVADSLHAFPAIAWIDFGHVNELFVQLEALSLDGGVQPWHPKLTDLHRRNSEVP